MRKSTALLALLAAALLAACGGNDQPTASAQPAELLLRNGYVYTSGAVRSVAQAVAVKDGLILAVGSDAELQALKGPDTEVIDLQGRMLMPGLQDSHIHIFGIVEPDVCSLRSQPMKLDDMVPYLQECVQRYAPPPGEWLAVDMWNFAEGNQVSEQYPNLRAALDAVSGDHPIILWGNDSHHGAVNSRALATAREAFRAEHGFHPGQCTISYGVMADAADFMMEHVRRLSCFDLKRTGPPRYYLESAPNGPEGWGFRATPILMFPR